jgi:hypothetical protein
MMGLKNTLKSWLLPYRVQHKFSPAVQVQQRHLFLQYQQWAKENKLPAIADTGFSVFSQFEEDGMLLFLFAVLGEGKKTFIEIGANDGVNSNCSNLLLNFGWNGLFIEGSETNIRRGQKFYRKYPNPYSPKPTFTQAMVKRENINELIRNAGLQGDIDLLSVDIDGNDYWVWDALEAVSPRVVVIETHVEFGYNNIVVPYDPDYFYPGKHPVYHGASPVAMEKLAKKKGYRLVGANQLGFNPIFVRNDQRPDLIPEVSVESILQHPKTIASFREFEAVKDWEYVRP